LGDKIHSKHVSWKAVLKTLGRLQLVEKEKERERERGGEKERKKMAVENVVLGSDCGRCVNICSSNS